MRTSLGPLIILLGVALIVAGALIWSGGLQWFGHLPGDIRIERESVHVYVPIVSMILVSVVLTLVVNLIGRFF